MFEDRNIYDAIRDKLDDEGENEDFADFVSEGEGEDDLDALEPLVKFDDTFPTTAFISGTPKVGQAKFDRLLSIIQKFINKWGENELYMPIDPETQMTYGFVVATFKDKEVLDTVCERLDGLSLDKHHVFKVARLDDFDSITSRQDEFVAKKQLSSFSRADFRNWLAERKCREQLLLRYHAETEIYWHDCLEGKPVLCYGGEREKAAGLIWCDWRVQFSPQGSYLATWHAQGIALWAGPEFTKKVRLPHAGVKAIEFSPSEEYVMLWNGSMGTEDDPNAYAFYHVLTGKCVKKFRCPSVAPLGEAYTGGGVPDFPHFLWSADGHYFAECNDSKILVRDTKTFDLIKDDNGKRSALKFDSLSTFQWSPKDNILAAWTLEKDNNPARLVLVEIPSRMELASRSRTQCEATMHWQSEGDYLCLLVTKLSKTKKKGATNLEIFRVRDRGIPVDIVTVNDPVRGFFWESRGNRFAVLTADEAGHKPKLLIYMLGKEKAEEIVNFDLPSNSFNHVFWAPDGQYFVVAATGQSNGELLFAGLNADNKLDILYKDEHFMCTDVHWDPSSRYVITAVTHGFEVGGYQRAMEAGYAIRTFQGRVLQREQKEKLYQVCWRPHPPSLLSPSKQKDVKKNIKQWSKKYDAMDDQAKDAARQAFRRERQEKTDAFLAVLDRLGEYQREKEEENGWGEAIETFQIGQGWVQEDYNIEEELDVTEEMIAA